MSAVVIVQARYGSSRLPGKVMMNLGGKTVLSHVLDRCKKIKGVDIICCAVSEDSLSDGVAEEAEKNNVIVCRGSESDVLNRYYVAAKKLNAKIVMRVTSDCPIIDPVVCAKVIEAFDRTGADYACNNMPPTWPHGLDCELFKFEWLARANFEAKKPSEREHVTQYIRNNSAASRVNYFCQKDNVKNYRWTLDTKQDYDFFKELFKKTNNQCAKMSWLEILGVIDQKLLKINMGQDRYEGLNKSLLEDKKEGF